ncbi:MAG TPA: hypothetical protein VKR56_00315 [Candidatus Cybelea sp.]|nr:hypothetical protein [Candidatus Cybelea sp.]
MKPASRMKSAVLRKRFMHTAVADILRAAGGGALPASATLALCTLDYLAYLSKRAGGNSENYQRLVEDYIVPINSLYRPNEIYAWRCSMVHTYAESDAMLAADLGGYLMRHHDPGFHLSSWRPRTLSINVDTFVADVVWAAHRFFLDLDGDRDVEARAEGLLVVSGGSMDLVAGYSEWFAEAMSYESMHPALRQLDAESPDLKALRGDVSSAYPVQLFFRTDGTMTTPTSGSARGT